MIKPADRRTFSLAGMLKKPRRGVRKIAWGVSPRLISGAPNKPRRGERDFFSVVLLLLVLVFLTVTLRAQNWPSFRGENALGVADKAFPPTTWDAGSSKNIRWKTAIPGLAHSSPVVWGDRLFITTAVGHDPNPVFRHGLYGDVDSAKDLVEHEWKLYCLDKNTGQILWERTAHRGVPKIKRHIKNTHASSTPVTDGKHVAAFFGSEGLYCYDFDGKLLWKQDLGVLDAGWFYDPDYQWGTASSPIIFDNLVIIQCDSQKNSFIAAFDLKTGRQVWRTAREEIPSWGTPTVFRHGPLVELVTNGSRFIRGYDPKTGQELWRLANSSEITAPTPFFAQDLIFFTAGYRPNRPIYAIRPGARGDISLKSNESVNEYVAWSRMQGGPYMPTPIVYGDYLYTCANHGVLTCYNAATGEQIYQQRIGDRGGAYSASPVAADGKLYFTSEDGEIFVVKAGAKYELLSVNPLNEVCMATPAISQGMIFIRTRNHIVGIGEQ